MIAASDGARLVGYARVSTQDQDLALQIDALLQYGVAKELIFTDKASARRSTSRTRYLPRAAREVRCPARLATGSTGPIGATPRDTDRSVARTPRRLPVGLRRADRHDDFFRRADLPHLFVLAQFDRWLIQERTKAGLAAARARGRKGGRPPIKANDRRIVLANKLLKDKSIGVDDICATLKISKSTLYRYVGMKETAHQAP